MARCKHWHNGICKDCTKDCPIKASLTRKAAKIAQAAQKNTNPQEADVDFAVVSPLLTEALAHGERVARLAEKVFAALSPVCGITAPWDSILRAAARLHDIGWVYGQKAHHKTSARMIRSGSVEEIEKQLRPLVALVARYHRGTGPSARQRRFAELSSSERRGVRRMAAILRLTDALDFSHAGLVNDLEIVVEKNTVSLLLDCPEGCAAEVKRLTAKKELFQKVFKKDVMCQCKSQESSMPTLTPLEPAPEESTKITTEMIREATTESTVSKTELGTIAPQMPEE